MNKQMKGPKKLPLSWMRKLSNTEFAGFSNMLWLAISRILSDTDFNPQYLRQLKDINAELQVLRPVPTSHHNTQLINQGHAERKKILSYIVVRSGVESRMQLHPSAEQEHYVYLHQWMRGYGKRLYDLGIDKHTFIVKMLEQDYEMLPEFKLAIDTCFPGTMQDMSDLTNKIIDAQFARSTELAQQNAERGYTEVRRDVTFELQSLLSLALYEIRKGSASENVILMYATISQMMAQQRGVVKERDTKRENRLQAAPVQTAEIDNVAEPTQQPLTNPEATEVETTPEVGILPQPIAQPLEEIVAHSNPSPQQLHALYVFLMVHLSILANGRGNASAARNYHQIE